MEKFDYNKYTSDVVNKMFDNNYLIRKIQIEQYNDFIECLIPTIISQYNPLCYTFYDEVDNLTYKKITIKNSRLVYPKVCDNDGTVNELTASLSHECKYDFGGYFIINGVEKVIVLQERCIDNKGLCFYNKNNKYKYSLELKSSVQNKFLPTKPL